MTALKWIGYIVATLLVLSVVVGVGFFIAAAIAIGGALVSIVMLILGIGSWIKGACIPPSHKG